MAPINKFSVNVLLIIVCKDKKKGPGKAGTFNAPNV